jgi:hypothetical protein
VSISGILSRDGSDAGKWGLSTFSKKSKGWPGLAACGIAMRHPAATRDDWKIGWRIVEEEQGFEVKFLCILNRSHG